MDVVASLTHGEQYGVWVTLTLLFLVYAIVIFPLRYFAKRQKFRRQISSHLITSSYKLPEKLSPAELSYLFSPSIKKRHIIASLMQLLNDGLLVSKSHEGALGFSIGPRVDSMTALSDTYLIDSIEKNDNSMSFGQLVEGDVSYSVPNTRDKVSGSKVYVFWWLVRQGLRQRGVIVDRPVKAYFSVIITTLRNIFLLSILNLFTIQLLLLIFGGQIDIDSVISSIKHTTVWFFLFFPLEIVISFITVRFRGRLLGRGWILTAKKARLLGQFDAYREYVRLVQRGDVLFEHDEAKKRARSITQPYAVALGYARTPSNFV